MRVLQSKTSTNMSYYRMMSWLSTQEDVLVK